MGDERKQEEPQHCLRRGSGIGDTTGKDGRGATQSAAMDAMAHTTPTLLPIRLEPAHTNPTLLPIPLEPAHAPDGASLPTRAARCLQYPGKLELFRAPSTTSSAASRAGTPERWVREECEEYEEHKAAGCEGRAAFSEASLVLAAQLLCVQLVLALAWCAVACAPALRASAIGAWQLFRVSLSGLCEHGRGLQRAGCRSPGASWRRPSHVVPSHLCGPRRSG